MIEIRLLRLEDLLMIEAAGDTVFDHPIATPWAQEFLTDPRHHLMGAIGQGRLVGFASAVHYLHPDKPPELWINEVGVADEFQRQGIGKRLMQALLNHGRALGCVHAWVLTEHDNAAARALYASVGGEEDETVFYGFPLS